MGDSCWVLRLETAVAVGEGVDKPRDWARWEVASHRGWAAEDSCVVVREGRQLRWMVVVDRRLSYLLVVMPGHCVLWVRMRSGELERTLEVVDSSFAPSSAGLRCGQQTDIVWRTRC